MILNCSDRPRQTFARFAVSTVFGIAGLTGCAWNSYQAPAPVYENRPPLKTDPQIPPSKNDHQDLSKSTPVKPQPAPNQTTDPQNLTIVKPFKSQPAVIALLEEADQYQKKSDWESAVAVTERALRIDGRNPHVTYRLAQYRLQQGKLSQAEALAKKAALLAGSDRSLKKQCWYLIYKARLQQNNVSGAQEAKTKAEQI
jgi:tetratricopeptide (TPR) repeat protein